MNWKRVIIDPSFWILLIANILLIYNYERNPKIFTTLVWLYLGQNVLYGFFNFLDILTLKKVDTTGYEVNDDSEGKKKEFGKATAWVFLCHYGFFHVVYAIFLSTMNKSGPFDWSFFKYYLAVFFIFQVVNFIQHKMQDKERAGNLQSMFGAPYLRIIPMHLCILVPTFLNVSGLTVFLVLKLVADVFMYVATNAYYKKGNLLAEATAANIKSTMLPD